MTSDEKNRFAIAMGRVVTEVLEGYLSPTHAAERLRKGAEWLEKRDIEAIRNTNTRTEKEAEATLQASMKEVRDVFEHWQRVTGRPRSTLTDQRKVIIRNALKKFSIEQLKHITEWCITDDWYSGVKNGTRYDWPKYMWNSIEKIESLLEKSGWKDNEAKGHGSEYEQLRLEATEALDAKDITRYNELQSRLRDIQSAETGDKS